MTNENDSILVFEYFTASGEKDKCIISEAEALIFALLDDLKDFKKDVVLNKSYENVIKDFDNVEVDIYEGLLAEYAKMKNAVAVVKGLRAVSDFEYEFQQAQMNKKLNSELETVFINTRVENLYLSSSAVKQICELGGDISDFVPEIICEDIVERIKRGVGK